MLWLAAHMWILLITAFAVGLGVGWWIWGTRVSYRASVGRHAPMGTLDSDLEAPVEESAAEKGGDEPLTAEKPSS